MTRRIGTKHRTHDVRSELLFTLETTEEAPTASQDYISQLPDECLARILNLLGSGDRRTASLVSKHMLRIEGRSRRRLTLPTARPDLLPSLLSRFDAVTELVLRCHRNFIIDADDTLVLIGKHCGDRVKELVLVDMNVTCIGIESVAWYFKKLERLTLRGSNETSIGDEEISCVAAKCAKLKKLCIKGCSVTDEGIKAFAFGCPDLVEIEVKRCRGVTCEVLHWLRARRKSLVVNLDVGEVGADGLHSTRRDGGGGSGDGGRQQNGVDIPTKAVGHRQVSDGLPPIFRSRFWDFEFQR